MYEKLSKNALKCMYLATGVGTIIIVAIIIAVEIIFLFPLDLVIFEIIGFILMGLSILNLAISPWFRYHRYKYKIDKEAIDIVEGYVFVERNIVPIERLHKLEMLRGPIDRLCKVSKVKVTTAGGDVVIRFLDEAKADAIVESLKKKINEVALEEKSNS